MTETASDSRKRLRPSTRKKIKQAYAERDGAAADDATVYFGKFGSLNFVEGETSNKKITYPSDLPDIRTGCGFDLHTLEKGRRLILGGREIPCDAGLKGHSDADDCSTP